MLPLADLPPGWTVGKSGDRAPGDVQRREPLREDRRPRRELHPVRRQGDGLHLLPPDRRRSNEVQVYIFEMADSLKALGKYGSEKPEEVKAVAGRHRGLHLGRQLAVLRGPVLHPDRLDQGRPQVRGLRARAGQAGRRQKPEAQAPDGPPPDPADGHCGRAKPPAPTAKPSQGDLPGDVLRPAAGPGPGRRAKYVAQDVFGYSFLSDVFMADYKDGDVDLAGLPPPLSRRPRRPRPCFEKYLASAKQDGAEVKTLEAEGADQLVDQLQHRPGRRRLPQGERHRRSQRRDRAPPRPRPSPGLSPRPCPPPSRRSKASRRNLEPPSSTRRRVAIMVASTL